MTNQKSIILTPHFTWGEVIFSQTADRFGISNIISSDAIRDAVINTAHNMELVREVLGQPIYISSWYRCILLNRKLGSKDTSQHLKGEAVDFTAPLFGSPLDICRKILASKLDFDQLILEHTWVHISFVSPTNPPIRPNRNQVLSLSSDGHYFSGLTDKNGKVY